MKHRLLQAMGWALLATVLVPLVWDRHATYWSWLVLSDEHGELPLLARAFVIVPVLLGVLVLLRDRLMPGRTGSVVLAIAAAFGCVSILGWKSKVLTGLGGLHGFSTPLAATVIVVGLVLALGYDLAKGYRIAAAGGIAGLVAAFLPFDGYMLAHVAWLGATGPGRGASALPLGIVGLGVLACLVAVSLFLVRGRPLRAWIVLWSLPVVFLMGSSVLVQFGWGPEVERFSGWLGWFISRFCPMAVVLGVAVAELLVGTHAPVGPRPQNAKPSPAMTAAECGRRLRLLRDREKAKRLAPEVARAQRVETLRAAVAAARTNLVRGRALLAEVEALEKDGALSAVEATSVRGALKGA